MKIHFNCLFRKEVRHIIEVSHPPLRTVLSFSYIHLEKKFTTKEMSVDYLKN